MTVICLLSNAFQLKEPEIIDMKYKFFNTCQNIEVVLHLLKEALQKRDIAKFQEQNMSDCHTSDALEALRGKGVREGPPRRHYRLP
ncbi:unnamed protein product [Pieris macdunnoughi]|uniref:Uncharacterized protein n=1 Tax=Pieris macdunnoughi TaxID=345717 RepID=A0A821X1T8_9NEOP|nr:unnamed protein product [Pieris macdunnoughi]